MQPLDQTLIEGPELWAALVAHTVEGRAQRCPVWFSLFLDQRFRSQRSQRLTISTWETTRRIPSS